MKISEVFESIQGESSWSGLPCVFVRFFGCNLNCSYCDSIYATKGKDFKDMGVKDVGEKIISYNNGIVEFTGGEPLLQLKSIIDIIKYLRENNPEQAYHFLIETNGSIELDPIMEKFGKENLEDIYFIMDFKMLSSDMHEKMVSENLNCLRLQDEIKFVCGTRKDYEVARTYISELKLGNAIISPVFGMIEPRQLAEWILEDKLKARFQIQMHKIIWDQKKRGV